MLIRSDRRWIFASSMAELWTTINEVDQFAGWWPWLRRFDGTAIAVGQTWHSAVRPPLPYTVDFDLTIERVLPLQSISASISGDIVGTAQIELESRVRGCCVHLTTDLGPSSQSMSALSKLAKPVVRFGHNWILDSAAKQFADHALPKH